MGEKIIEVDIQKLKLQCIEQIRRNYGMSVLEFSKSEVAKKAKLKHLPIYLSPNGNISLPVLRKLCLLLKLGTLEKKVSRSIKYSLCP